MRSGHRPFNKVFLMPLFLFLILWARPLVLAQTNPAVAAAAPPIAIAPEAVEPVLFAISDFLENAQFEQALALFDSIPAVARNSSDVRLLEASVLSSVGRFAEARTIVQAINQSDPQNIDALFLLAAIEGVEGRDRQQREALERILAIDTNNTEARIALGNLHLSVRALRDAADNFRHVITMEPQNVDALLGMGRLLRINQEWNYAEAFFNRVVELHPNMAEGRSERARFYRQRGRLGEALADLDAAMRLSPGDYWIAIDRGTILMDMGRRPQALAEFERAIAINPDEFFAYIFTSGLRETLGDLDGAQAHYAILARLRPDYHYALEGLGLHLMRNERWAEARDAFLEAHRQAPTYNHYALLAGINWIRMRTDPMGARNFLRHAIARVQRDSLEWHMFRLFYDLAANVFAGETNMLTRLNREQDETLRARMTFYMALFFDIRGNTNMANRHFLMVHDINRTTIPEWRLNRWILEARSLTPL